MKNFVTCFVFVAIALFSTVALAETDESTDHGATAAEATVEHVVIEGVDPSLAACIARCKDGELPNECAPADKAAAKTAASTAKHARERRAMTLSMVKTKLSILQINTSGAWKEILELHAQAKKLEEEMAAIRTYLDSLKTYLEKIEGMVAGNTADIATLKDDVGELRETDKSLDARVTALENSQVSLVLGARLAGLYMCSADETCYGGLAFGPRFGMDFAGTVVAVDAQVMTGGVGENPYGGRIRLGGQFLLSRSVALETGVGAAFADYDPALDAKSTFVGGDIGLTLTPGNVVSAGAALFAGMELDQDDVAPAIGGILTLGVDLPR